MASVGSGKSGLLIKSGFAVLAVGASPLLAYIAFGPKDGNPIGLGLLFVAAMPVALVLLAAGGLGKLAAAAKGRPGPEGGTHARGSRAPNRAGSKDDWP